jgi:Eukaryotic and archaeal DNA primase, large subunit
MRRHSPWSREQVLGLPIEEAISFWRESYANDQKTQDKFNKEYKYNIRHSYGLEGKRANYPAREYVHKPPPFHILVNVYDWQLIIRAYPVAVVPS